MTAVTLPHDTTPPQPPTWWSTRSPLILAALGGLVLPAVAALGLALDPRTITGAPAWIVSPVLALTLMLGSLGFLLYLAARRLSGPEASGPGSPR